ETRNGTGVSLRETVARVAAPVDVELAKQLSPRAEQHAHTMKWRQRWWGEIWRSAHSTSMLAAFGHGYGFDLISLAPKDVRAGQPDMRTPHSVFYYALGYTGWVGVTLFALLQLIIAKMLYQSYRRSEHTAGLVFWAAILAMSFFEAGFDTPYRAIPLYLIVGMGMAPGLVEHADVPDAKKRVHPAPTWSSPFNKWER
ncbi:MAG: O-antigen polymerase, partial [Planctomycetota bacterium]